MEKPLLWHVEELGRAVLFRPLYVRMTGDLIAGLLLSQIVWWFRPDKDGKPKDMMLFDGIYWVAKRRTDWKEEIGVNPRQFDRGCDLLVSLNLVKRKVMMRGACPMVHLHLDVAVLSERLKPYYRNGKNMDVTDSVISDVPKSVVSYRGGKTRIKTKKVDMATAKEIQASLLAKQKYIPESLPVEKVKPGVLYAYWCKAVSVYYGGFVGPAKKKELGQLAHWIKAVGVANAYRVMVKTVERWHDFGVEVNHSKAARVGTQPTIGALLTHADVAMAIATEDTAIASKPKVKSIAKPKGRTKFVFEDGDDA